MIQWSLGRFAPIEKTSVPMMIAFSVVMFGIRLFLAAPFWASGQTRWIQFPTNLASSTTYLFENEFMLHFGFFEMPIPFGGFVGYMTGLAEIILPVLIVVGLMTRFSALALLAMTIVIELVFPEAWPIHIQWAIAAGAIAYCGPGLFSVDAAIRKSGILKPGPAAAAE